MITRGTTSTKGVIIYGNRNYQGCSQKLIPGMYSMGDLLIRGCLSSLKVPAGTRVTLYKYADFTGMKKLFITDTSWVGDDFFDKTCSIIVESLSGAQET
jgi:hypothetical protein